LRVRRGDVRDIAAIGALLDASDLPPLFVAEFIRGVVVVESEAGLLACGGLEPYGRSGIVRSVAVSADARALGLGKRVAGLLIADAELSGLRRLFLSASDAAGFWASAGFHDRPMGEWPEETRIAWQYRFFSERPEFMSDISLHTMERSLAI
jgi:amino-acid N-acetyltransferase